jgi:transcription termination factor NusB
MSRKDDLKLLFNFMIELLKEEETVQTEIKKENIEDEKQLLTENVKKDESVEKILKVMQRVEDIDKFKKAGIKIVPENERDLLDDYNRDINIIKTYKTEKKVKFINDVLHDAKNIMNEIETKLPITPSVPPDELNRIEENKNSEYSINQSKLGHTKNMVKIYTPHPEDK